MVVVNFPESETAPLARCRRVLVSSIQLNVLDGVAESQLMDTCATSDVPMHFHYRQSVYKLLSIGLMRCH